jgi:hypothetical protein
MAAAVADAPAIHMSDHGAKLMIEYAIRTAYGFFHLRSSFVGGLTWGPIKALEVAMLQEYLQSSVRLIVRTGKWPDWVSKEHELGTSF